MAQTDELERLHEQLREMQAKLMQSEKMAALGALTTGVAHELNNPIGFVKNNAAMLDEYMRVVLPALRETLAYANQENSPRDLKTRLEAASCGEDLGMMLDDIEPLLADTLDGVGRVEEIVGGLRRFARADSPEGELFDLKQCIEDTLKVAWNEIKYKANVVQTLEDTPPLFGKPGEINQVILNLLINAAQAIPEFGEIRIQTQSLKDEILLGIADDGLGISQEHMQRLFTPFFTTKPAGVGTGLGLSISRDIITTHGGRIEVASTPNKGSEFHIFLPLPAEMY
jgi:two-component system NtrC family sensor kinase